MKLYSRADHQYEPIAIICPDCGDTVTGTLDGEGGCGDDGTGIRWWLEDRTGCTCMDDEEVIQWWEEHL